MRGWQVSIGLGVLAMGLLAFMYVRATPPAALPEEGGQEEEGAALSAQLSARTEHAVLVKPAPTSASTKVPESDAAGPAVAPQGMPTPAPPQPDPTAAPDPEAPSSFPAPDRITGQLGPLKRAYESSSATPDAASAERNIRAILLKDPDIPIELESVVCHEDVCKVQLLWTREKSSSYMAATMLLGQHISYHMAAEPLDEYDPEDPSPSIRVDMYVLHRPVKLPGLQ